MMPKSDPREFKYKQKNSKILTPDAKALAEKVNEAIGWARGLLAEKPEDVLYLDTETTGLPNKDPETEIVSIAIINGSGDPVLMALVNPNRPIPEEASKVHKIYDHHVANSPDFAMIGPSIAWCISNKRVICYNAEFDIKLLVKMFKKYNIPIPRFTPECAMLRYSEYCGEWNERKSDYRWQKLPKESKGTAHDALVDCKSTLNVIHMMANSGAKVSKETGGGFSLDEVEVNLDFDKLNVNDGLLLEDRLSVDYDPVPLVLVDFQVICWDIYRHLEFCGMAHHTDQKCSAETLEHVIKALWATKLNRGPDMLDPGLNYRVVVVSDMHNRNGAYWRSDEILKDPRITECWEKFDARKKTKQGTTPRNKAYKGTRPKEKPNLWKTVYDVGWNYSTQFFPSYKAPGHEADDWAGELYRLTEKAPESSLLYKRQKFLLTIDRDWSGLVDKDKNIYWANTRYPGPNERIQGRLASEAEVLDHTEYKLGQKITCPKELYAVKAKEGEFSDNLPPEAPIEYIDLIAENPKYALKKEKPWSSFVATLSNPKANIRTSHYQESVALLRRAGMALPQDWYPTI